MSIREVKRTNGWSMVRIPQELHEKIQRMNFEKKSMTLFTIEVIEEGLKTKINRIGNPIRYFAEECIRIKRGNVVLKKTVYEHFQQYAEKHWGRPYAQAGFSRRFRQYAPAGVSETRIWKDGRRVRAWQNITLIRDQ